MRGWLSIVIGACSVSQAPVVAHVSVAEAGDPVAKIVPTLPCPGLSGNDPWNRELFPGCPAMPYTQPLATCPRGTCPRPCEIEVHSWSSAGPELDTQKVVYDTDGTWVGSSGGDSGAGLPDWSCASTRGRFDSCTLYFDGQPHIETDIKRDARGRITELVDRDNGWPPTQVGFQPDGKVSWLHSGRSAIELDYDARGRLAKVTSTYKRDRDVTTYRYNAAGSVAEANEGGVRSTYAYDRRGRLATVTTINGSDKTVVRSSYDAQDRLVELVHDGGDKFSHWTYRYKYSCP